MRWHQMQRTMRWNRARLSSVNNSCSISSCVDQRLGFHYSTTYAHSDWRQQSFTKPLTIPLRFFTNGPSTDKDKDEEHTESRNGDSTQNDKQETFDKPDREKVDNTKDDSIDKVVEAEIVDNNEEDDSIDDENAEQPDEEFGVRQFLEGEAEDLTKEESYGRFIDLARLTVETAYEKNDALVGALAEAGGDEGASERWLKGFVALMKASPSNLPKWWTHEQDEEKVFALANKRNGDFFIKRCVDREVLKKKLGFDDYNFADMAAEEIYTYLKLEGEYEGEEVEPPVFVTLTKGALENAKSIWGQDTVTEITRKNKQEIEEENEMKEMEKQGIIKKTSMEEGDWWGPATEEQPQEAYKRLLDAARYGSMLAHDRQGIYIGAVADAVGGMKIDDEFDDGIDDDDDDDEAILDDEDDSGSSSGSDSEEEDPSSDEDDGSDSDEEKAEGGAVDVKNDIDVETTETMTESEQTDALVATGDNDDQQAAEKQDNDLTYAPKEVGPEARDHFEKFLVETKKADAMPPWWNDEHEKAVWEMANDMRGNHCLAYPMDGEEMTEYYEDGARRKVALLANAAAAVGQEEENDWRDSVFKGGDFDTEEDIDPDEDLNVNSTSTSTSTGTSSENTENRMDSSEEGAK